MRQFRLWENAQCVQLLAPQVSSATQPLLSPFINVKFGHKIYLECDVNQGNAAQVTLTPLQGTGLLKASASLNASSSTTTLSFASVPAAVVQGMLVQDFTTPAAVPAGTTVVATTSTTVTLSAAASGAVSGDLVGFFPSGSLNAKVLNNPAPVAYLLNTAGNDQFSFTTGTSYQTDVGLNPKSVIFEIDPGETMDLNNLASFTSYGPAFRYVAIQVSASNASNLVACRAKILMARDVRQNPPTVFQ